DDRGGKAGDLGDGPDQGMGEGDHVGADVPERATAGAGAAETPGEGRAGVGVGVEAKEAPEAPDVSYRAAADELAGIDDGRVAQVVKANQRLHLGVTGGLVHAA